MKFLSAISFRVSLAVATSVALSAFAPVANAQTQTETEPERGGITVVIADDFPPYISTDEDAKAEGERIDMWNLWSRKTGVPVTILQLPWPQVLETLKNKQADVADMIGITPDRQLWLDYGPSFGHADVALFVRKDVTGIRNLASAKGETIGTLASSQCETRLREAGLDIRPFPSMHDLIYTAVIGQLPVFCLQTVPAAYLLNQAGIQDDYRQTEPVFTNTLHWTVRKGETLLFDRIDEGFRLIAPSEAAAISARWSGQRIPGIGIFSVEQTIRLLEFLGVIVVAALATAIVLRMRLGRALTGRHEVEDKLRQRIREQTCLHEVFLATDDMQRGIDSVLHDIAQALKKACAGPDLPLVRIELMGHVFDEIGSRDTTDAQSTPIMIEGKERGRITLISRSPTSGDAGMLLGLVASRIAGRALGATTLVMLQKSEERFRRTFQHSAQATAIIQEGRFVNANRAALDLLGYGGNTTFVGMTPAEISPAYQPDGEPSPAKADRLIVDMLAKGASSFEWEHLKKNGETVLVEVLLTAVTEDNRTDIFVLWNDITVKRQAEAALAAYQQTLEAQVAKRTQELTTLYDELAAIFATATAGIALVRDRSIVTCNPSLASILLWPHAELIGRSTRAFFKDEASWQEGRDEAYATMSLGGIYEKTVELVRLDGSTVWVRMRATSVDTQDAAKGTVWVLEDISSEHAARTQLAEARDLAVQAARLKSEFLANMSHELRSPINAVLGFTELLMGTNLADHQREFVQKVQASGRHLLLIVNDVLDLSKVEAGKLRIEQSEFSLPSVLRNVIDTISKGVADKNLELLLDIDPTVPRRLIGDPLRISQILMNYLTNAVKFTPTGTIHISIHAEPALATDGAEIHRLRFSVSDSGVGMTDEQVARMFQSFSQAEDSTARLYGGTGLGLSICRQLATLMEGEVGVSSVEGSGSTFWTTLPLRAIEPAPGIRQDKRLANRRILLIDDHPGARTQIANALERSGATVTSAESGSKAIAAFARTDHTPPDALVVDLKMPEMNGIKTIHALRDRFGKAMPPTVLMTKQGGQEMVDLTHSEGIEDLVIKPVDTDLLVSKLATLLNPAPATPRRERYRPDPLKGKSGSADLAATGKRVLVVDDNPLNRELAAALLGKHGLTVETAENGADGLERLLDQDFDVIFMDNQMPVMGGLEATRRIRALPTAKGRVPIIGLTGRATEDDHQDGLDAGMNDYLVKPFSPADLETVLNRWLPLDELNPAD